MTDTDTSLDVLSEIGQRIDNAYERTKIGRQEWIDGSLDLAQAMAEGRERFPSDNEFSAWLGQNNHDHVDKNDRAALIHFGRNAKAARAVFEETTRISYRYIWDDVKDWFPQVGKPNPEPESISNPAPETAGDTENEKPARDQQPVSTPTPEQHDAPKTSKLHELIGEEAAHAILSRFKLKSRTFVKQVTGKNEANDKTKLNYLAKRCVMPDYPVELLEANAWSLRLLYPHLPPKLFEVIMPKNQSLTAVHKHHHALIKTEAKFVLTPEFGKTDPPMIAFNKAYAIFQAIKNGSTRTPDPAAKHTPTFHSDEGKPPVIVRGTTLWPAESNSGYGYDDLRCAYNMAKDILLSFQGPIDAPMTTQSLKLRHVSAWLPPNGYNSTGATLAGMMIAWAAVVSAYGADKSEEMRSPTVSLIKKGE